ncbi:hypothetical protein ACRRTK_004909 [Alexandromys fortis]
MPSKCPEGNQAFVTFHQQKRPGDQCWLRVHSEDEIVLQALSIKDYSRKHKILGSKKDVKGSPGEPFVPTEGDKNTFAQNRTWRWIPISDTEYLLLLVIYTAACTEGHGYAFQSRSAIRILNNSAAKSQSLVLTNFQYYQSV